MARGPKADVAQRRAIQNLVDEGHGATAIIKELNRQGLLSEPHPTFHPRTIERMVQKLKVSDESGPWSLAEAETPEDAQLLLDVVLHIPLWTQGRVWISKDLAKWILRVRKASPTVPIDWAYRLARRYQARHAAGEDTRYLDLILASQSWEPDPTGEGMEALIELIDWCIEGRGELPPRDEDLFIAWQTHDDKEGAAKYAGSYLSIATEVRMIRYLSPEKRTPENLKAYGLTSEDVKDMEFRDENRAQRADNSLTTEPGDGGGQSETGEGENPRQDRESRLR
jgi:hypothetical protein